MAIRILISMVSVLFVLNVGSKVNAGFQDMVKDAMKQIEGGTPLTNDDIVNGLKEALEKGTSTAVQTVSKTDGYYKNPLIKIPLPDNVQKVEKILRATGFGREVDEFDLSMNRAAERAAPEAKTIFLDAVRQMTFTDARKILDGPDNAATLYFEDKTSGRLTQVFKPIVKESMNSVGVTRQYEDLNTQLSTIPMGGKLSFDLDQYVTAKSLKGLFYMMAQEEKKIRQNPAARTTDLLRKVFGGR